MRMNRMRLTALPDAERRPTPEPTPTPLPTRAAGTPPGIFVVLRDENLWLTSLDGMMSDQQLTFGGEGTAYAGVVRRPEGIDLFYTSAEIPAPDRTGQRASDSFASDLARQNARGSSTSRVAQLRSNRPDRTSPAQSKRKRMQAYTSAVSPMVPYSP